MLTVATSWLILTGGGGPTDDKPTVTLRPLANPDRTSAFLNGRGADLAPVCREWALHGSQPPPSMTHLANHDDQDRV